MVAYTWNGTTKALEGAKWWYFGRREGGSVLYIKPNKHKIICNSVKTSVIREKIDIKIDILELSKTFNNILEDSKPF